MNQSTDEYGVKGWMLSLIPWPSFSDSCKKTFQKASYQNSPSPWAIQQWYRHTKRFEAPALYKDKKKAKGRAFRTGIKQLFSKLFGNKFTRYESPWPGLLFVGCRSEMLSFCVTVAWPMIFEVFDVMFADKYVYVSYRDLWRSSQPQHWIFTRLITN